MTVTALGANGGTAAGYSGTVHFTSSDAKAVLPANATLTNGVGTFSVTLKTSGSQNVTATDTVSGSITGASGAISVAAAAASQFVFISVPANVASGASFSVTIEVTDAYSNVATNYSGTVDFSDSAGSATLPANYTFTAGDAGVHTLTGLVLKRKGAQTITVSDTKNGSITGGAVVTAT